MYRLSRSFSLLACLALIFSALPIPAQTTQIQHGVPLQNASGQSGSAPAGAHLSYFGGPVVSNAHVVQVLYGTGSYDPQVAGTSGPTMGNFFSDLLGPNSGYISLLSQYSTNISGGTDQIIGNGTFGGIFQITPSAGNNGSTIDDSNIQAELLAQINAGRLPAPVLDAAGNVNTIYMIYFPPGKTITDGAHTSCVTGGFCAYHGTTSSTLNSKHLLYGVLPDFQTGGCSTGCGASSVFGNYTMVTSHEVSEAITDADVGIATSIAAPLAWFDPNSICNGHKGCEIGDLCQSQQGSYAANGTTYTIQLEFSNAANCVLPPPVAQSPCVLKPNQVLSQNQTLPSCPTGFTLAMQGDGNLVLYNSAGSPLWYSHTYNPGSPNRATHAIMQGDGNFVLYNDSGVPVFATGTQGNAGATLSVQGDGNMVIYSPSVQPLWNSGTCCPKVSVTGIWSDPQVYDPTLAVYDNFTLTIRPNGTYDFTSTYFGSCSGLWGEHEQEQDLLLTNGFCHGALDTNPSFSSLDAMTYGVNPFYVPPTGPPLNWVRTVAF